MSKSIPDDTVQTFARTIHREATNYGFDLVHIIRLVNALLDMPEGRRSRPASGPPVNWRGSVESFPLRSRRLSIRLADPDSDLDLLQQWIHDEYGRHFLLTASSAQSLDLRELLGDSRNQVGIVCAGDDAIGAVAYLGIDSSQRRAELRKLIGEKSARGKGYAEEATHLWIQYGGMCLGLEKIDVSTLQTHLRNIQLNESIGFKVEGVLRREVRIDNERYDILRMGLCFDEYMSTVLKDARS